MPTLQSSIATIQLTLSNALGQVVKVYSNGASGSVDLVAFNAGKLFEVFALSKVLEEIKSMLPATYRLSLKNAPGGNLCIQGSPGQANLKHSHILILDQSGAAIARIWNSVEFLGISASKVPKQGSYHEADILIEITDPSNAPFRPYRPTAGNVAAVFECKFVQSLSKSILRNQLGLRREMSYVRGTENGVLPQSILYGLIKCAHSKIFQKNIPASCAGKHLRYASHVFLVYSKKLTGADPNTNWQDPAKAFGLEFWNVW